MSKTTAVLIGIAIGLGIYFVLVPPNAPKERVREFNEQIRADILQWTLIPAGFLAYHMWRES